MSICIADLFCGIGGVAEAVRHLPSPATAQSIACMSLPDSTRPSVVTAIDIDQSVTAVYGKNHGLLPRCCTIESLPCVATDATGPIDMWWMSPPCQPYTARGLQKGSADSRSQALAHLIQLIPLELPEWIGLENVPAFCDSDHHHELRNVLGDCGYVIREQVLCPTDWGIPMRRKRFYLMASRRRTSLSAVKPELINCVLHDFVDSNAWDDETLSVDRQFVRAYQSALSIVDADDPHAITSCFTSAYGKSPVRSGSYLRCQTRDRVRRFSANEIAALMGFRRNFFACCDLGHRTCYRLIGNALAVHVIRALLSTLLPETSERGKA